MGCQRSFGWIVSLLLIALSGVSFAQGLSPTAPRPSLGWMITSVGVLLLLISVFVAYMFYLQKHFLTACREDNQLATFFQSPAGLPPGTIRSMMTLIIVTSALYLILVTMFMGPPTVFPEVMAAVLSTVVGFYFGSRSSARQDDGASEELVQARQQKDVALAEKDETVATGLLKKVDKGITLAKTVVNLLPAETKKKYGGTLEALERGARIAGELFTKGDARGAATHADEVFTLFKQDNPLRHVVTQALGSFAQVAGVSVPPIALIAAVVGISTTLIGTAYAKWKARVLRLPFSPSVVPLKMVDADTGMVLALQSPILKEAFRQQLTLPDRPFMESLTEDFLSQETTVLWEKYRGSFESRQAFEQGLEEFRRGAATLELQSTIEPALVQEVGGVNTLMTALDQIEDHEAAGADLDLLMELIEGLRKTNEPVQSIFEKVRQEVAA